MTPVEIGKHIRRRRKELQITQGDLARLASCSKPSIIAAEGGKATLRLDKLQSILETLGLTLLVADAKTDPE